VGGGLALDDDRAEAKLVRLRLPEMLVSVYPLT
jgi:hypothetical protein